MRGFLRIIWRGTGGVQRHLRDTICPPSSIAKKYSARSSLVFLFLLFFLGGGLFATRFLDATVSSISVSPPPKTILSARTTAHVYPNSKIPQKPLEIPLNCSSSKPTCPPNHSPAGFGLGLRDDQGLSSPSTCPDYFRWIHEDLRPWRETGITIEMVERARRTANFRLLIVDGRAYMVKYRRAFQTRDVFTLWGILQLLRRYPGKVPDLDLTFDCFDRPVVRSTDYSGPNATAPPPLFRYCGDDTTLDIAFPDWTFWGWPELNIKPWEGLVEELKEGNKRRRWIDRESYAYWKGNPMVAAKRMDLLKCNVSDKHDIDWGARLFPQDWIRESQQGYKQSDLASQCIHRYKIYIEGTAWSVSEKYILACDSVTLLVKPHYYDFFSRSLMPMRHYWPIRDDDKCRSIKFAVDWGNSHQQKAKSIGKAASDFIRKELKMDYVYDYMFHLLNEYAKLMRYKPTVPRKAIELCSDTMSCSAKGLQKKFMMESIVKGPADVSPCTMPPPYDPLALHSLLKQKSNSIRQVELWEKKFWDTQITHS